MKKVIFVSVLLVFAMISYSYANTFLHTKKEESIISTGTNLIKYEILTSDGWVEAQVLEVDLDDENTKLGLLYSSEGTKKLDSVKNMVMGLKAIAGINGDYFAGSSGIGSSIGTAIDNSKIYSSSSEENKTKDTFTSFIMSDDGKIFYEYLTDEIKIYNDNGFSMNARYVNKYTDNTDIPTIYTREWGELSIGKKDNLYITEIVVENGKVIEIRDNEEPVEIPENGFVIMCTGENANKLKENLRIKSKAYYEVNYTPNIDKINFIITGGTKLIENGIIPESYSHVVSGKNPRTVIGTNKKKDKVYLITIDGRSKTSIGMTLDEVSEFLKEIGVYSAINLDGGGSTTMVARKLGEETISEINHPSGGTERLVANGVGIFSNAPSLDKLAGLDIIVEDHNVFVGEKRKVNVVGYDKYYNPVEIDESKIKWDYDGVEIEYEDGYISGKTVGSAELIAKIGKIQARCEINILSEANEISISPKEKFINPGEKVTYLLKAKNKNGYYASTNLDTFKIKIDSYYKNGELNDIPSEATIENNTFTTTISGTYILCFSKGNCKSYAKVQVGQDKFVLIDDFEKTTFSFDPYPDEVGGSTKLSDEKKYSGTCSVRLDYDFDKEAKVRGAYIVLDNDAIIPESATAISFCVYNEEYKDEKLKIKLKDANNATKLIVIQDNISHEGWKEIRYDVSNLAKPLRISDIYLAQDDVNIRTKGFIYVDRLGYYENSSSAYYDGIYVPKDEKIEDQNNISIKSEKSFDISFLDEFETPNKMIEVLKTQKLIQHVNESSDLTIFTKNVSDEFKNAYVGADLNQDKQIIGSFEIEKINHQVFINEQYDLLSNNECTIITMDISQKGIRKSDETQYSNLESDIKDDDTGVVILVLNGSIDDFEDEREKKLFVDILCELKRETKKEIVVVHDGSNQDYSMERGVKFLSIKDTNRSDSLIHDARFLLISVKNGELSYEYKKAL